MLRAFLSIIGVYRIYSKWLRQQIKDGDKPKHIGVILDGNRRWAKKSGFNVAQGHGFGAEKVREFLDWCIDLGIKSVTLYVFSIENFQRDEREVAELMELFEKELKEISNSDVLEKNRVRIKFIGRKQLLPKAIQKLVRDLEDKTERFDNHYLNIAIAYGGRGELEDAVRTIGKRVKEGAIKPEDIDEKIIEKYLYTSHLPQQDSDLIIRTSGEERLSNFLLWQSAYSELYFCDVYWPAFRKIDFWRAVRMFQSRERRFGR